MKALRKKRWWILALVLATPILLLTGAHLQGKWALSRLRRDLTARGEKLLVEENEPQAPRRSNGEFRELMFLVSRIKGAEVGILCPPMGRQPEPGKLVPLHWLTNWPTGRARSNATWTVLTTALASSSNLLGEAQLLLKAPLPAAHLDYHLGFNMLLPHLASLKGFAQHLSGAVAESLQAGRLDLAKDQLRDLLAVGDLLKSEPILISQLVRCSIVAIGVQTTWQALQVPGWTDEQLLDLQRTWQAVDMLPEMMAALEMERAIVLESYGSMRRSPAVLTQYLGMGGGPSSSPGNAPGSLGELIDQLTGNAAEVATQHVLLPIWHFSFSYGDEAHYLKSMQFLIESGRTCAKQRSAEPIREAKRRIEEAAAAEGALAHVRHLMSRNFFGALVNSIDKALGAETQKEIVLAAIAVQRYTLRYGHPPGRLEELVPQWADRLPHDYWAGNALSYAANSNAAPRLYSVGPDGRDAGGNPTNDATVKNPALFTGRDMVWPVAVTETELPAALKALGCNTNDMR